MMSDPGLGRLAVTTALWLWAASLPARAEGAGAPTLKLTPPAVEMGMFYSGAELRIEGTVQAGSEPIVVIRGAGREEIFNKKGKAGPIWVNVGKVRISGVPSLFLRFSPEPVRNFVHRAEIDEHQLDEASIRHQMRIEPDQDRDAIVESWLALKAQEGTYGLSRQGVRLGTAKEGRVPYWVEFHWPKKAPPARCQVSVYECRDGTIIGTTTATLPVLKVGVPAGLAKLAAERAVLYGVVAVVAAAVFGFGIDFLAALIFGRKRAAAH